MCDIGDLVIDGNKSSPLYDAPFVAPGSGLGIPGMV